MMCAGYRVKNGLCCVTEWLARSSLGRLGDHSRPTAAVVAAGRTGLVERDQWVALEDHRCESRIADRC